MHSPGMARRYHAAPVGRPLPVAPGHARRAQRHLCEIPTQMSHACA